ncbi:MAG: 50S ribosomal protein L9 [Rhizobiaceae bacterium]|nr:50S ribosomal protein L9 [Rhizobiaceae bacterium]MBL4733335.1 50S ribosomal protein L9 [Rhizobiaceae bacterium]
MKIILLERIARLGQMGDVVTVKDGFARNFLLPQGKALRATEVNSARFEEQRVELEARNLERKSEAEAVKEKLDGTTYVSIRSAGQTGQLYGSVSTRDIAEMLEEAGFKVARNQINLLLPIKVIGLHEVQVILHPEVNSNVVINVARSDDEAGRQAAGEDLTGRDTAYEHEVYDHGDEDDEVDLDEVFENSDDAEEAETAGQDEASDEESK